MRKIAVLIGILFLLVACSQQTAPKVSQTQAAETVYKYFDAWNKQDYATMYSIISDGFKNLEPTAKTLEDFTSYENKQRVTAVKINSIIDKQNTGEVAVIEYDVVLTINGKATPYKSSLTVKKKPYDSTPGWKIIQPYGNNVDTT